MAALSVPNFGRGAYKRDWDIISGWFGSPDSVPWGFDYTDRPVTKQTLGQIMRGENMPSTRLLQTNFVDLAGWETEIAPLTEQENLSKIVEKKIFHAAAMRVAPDESVPQFLTDSSESFKVTMFKYHAAFEVDPSSLLTIPGQQLFSMKTMQAVSSIHITIKLIIGDAIINTPNDWDQLTKNTNYYSISSALQYTQDNMFVANKMEKCLYVANAWVKDRTVKRDPQFDSLIVSFGTLNLLVFGNNFETEAMRIGQPQSYDRLINTKDSLKGAFKDLDIYEDNVWAIQNVHPWMMHMLRRRHFLGEFVVLDGTDFGHKHGDNYSCDDDTSINLPDVDLDSMVALRLSDFVKNDVGWAGDEPNPFFGSFLQNQKAHFLQRGLEIHNNMIHPWIYRSNRIAPDGAKPTTDGFYLAKVWGNQEFCYRNPHKDILHGVRSAQSTRRTLPHEVLRGVEEKNKLADQLTNTADITLESIKGYFFATAAITDNWDSQGYEAGNSSIYLKGGSHASPLPPYVDKNPGHSNPFPLDDGRNFDRTQAEDLNQQGVLYIMRGGRKYYLFALYYEDVDWSLKLNRNFVQKFTLEDGNVITIPDSTTEAGVSPIFNARESASWSTVDVSQASELFSKEMAGKLAGFVLLPFDSFGRITPAGTAPDWLKYVSNTWSTSDPTAIEGEGAVQVPGESGYLLSNEAIYAHAVASALGRDRPLTGNNIAAGEAAINRELARILELIPNKRGIKAPQLVVAPPIPHGMGYMNSLRTIADLYSNGCRGWNKEIFEKASNGVSAFDTYADHMIERYKDCELLNGSYTAAFMHTGNSQEDIRNNIDFNLIMTARDPVWVRIPAMYVVSSRTSAGSAESNDYNVVGYLPYQTLQNSPTTTLTGNLATRFNDEQVIRVATAMGLHNAGGDGNATAQYGDNPRITDQENVTVDLFIRTLSSILNNRNLAPRTKDDLKDANKANRLFELFKSNASNIGRSYVLTRRSENPNAAVNQSFACFFASEVIPTRNVDKQVYLFDSIMSFIYYSLDSHEGNTTDITRALISGLKENKGRSRTAPLHEDDTIVQAGRKSRSDNTGNFVSGTTGSRTELNTSDASMASAGYINTRLVLSDEVWQRISNKVQNTNNRGELLDLYMNPLRPSNPNNPVEPLGGFLLNVDSINSNRNTLTPAVLKEQLGMFKAARAGASNRSAIHNTVFGNVHMFASTRQANRQPLIHQGPIHKKMKSLAAVPDPYAPLAHQPHLINPQIASDTNGPFYSMEEYVDRDGRPLPGITTFVREENLEKRYANAYHGTKDIFVRVASLMFLLSRLTKSGELKWLSCGLPIPDSCFLGARVGAVDADLAIWIKKGDQTAQSGFKFNQNMLVYDGIKDQLTLRYTCYLGAWVIDQWKIYPWEAFRAANYLCGLGTTFYNHADQFDPSKLSDQKRCIFGFNCGSEFGINEAIQKNPICLTLGKYDMDMFAVTIQDQQGKNFSTEQQVPSWAFMDYLFNFFSMKPQMWPSACKTYRERKASVSFDGLIWLRYFTKYNSKTGTYTNGINGTSALGNAIPPMKAILNGGLGIFCHGKVA